MKKVILLIWVLILAGCYNPDVTELEPYIPYIAEVNLSDLDHAISLEGVEYLESFDNIEASSIQDYINNKKYMTFFYGGMDIAENEAKFMQIVEEKLFEFDQLVAILLKSDEIPLVELEELYKNLMNTDDQISATLLGYRYSVERVDEGIFIEIINDYTTNLYEYNQVVDKMDELIFTMDLAGLTEYEKVKMLYQYVMDRMTYKDLGTKIAHSPMGFLFHGEGVCQAYAVSMHMLFERAGIESRYIIGNIHEDLLFEGESGAHAWNMVKLDGNWYHLDATWDDEEPHWKYFLVSDTGMSFSRSWETQYYEKAESPYIN